MRYATKIRASALGMLFVLVVAFGLLPGMALAADPVPYRAWDDTAVVDVEDGCTDYAELVDQTTWGVEDSTTWYVLKESRTIDSRITVAGDVHLILCDGKTLTAKAGITVADDDDNLGNGSPNSLSVYAQSDDEGMGALLAGTEDGRQVTGNENAAGIGGDCAEGSLHCGVVNIHGGAVTACGKDGAGIGGGYGSDGGCHGGTVTVHGGSVNASSIGGAGIGGGGGPLGNGGNGTATINGGTVRASSDSGAGIGGGWRGIGMAIINGGTVRASSDSGAGIGGGREGNNDTATINGGTVNASSIHGAGIGGGYSFNGYGGCGGTVTVNGGAVTATGGDGAKGIGAGSGVTDDGTLALGASVELYGGSSADPTNLLATGPLDSYTGNRFQYMKAQRPVASVTVGSDTSKYAALEGEGGALEAWTDGSTLTLLADCSITNTIALDAAAGSRTLDLGGKTLTSSENAFSMRGGSLELKDSGDTGKIDATSGSVIYLSDRYSGSSVTMSGGTITASGSGGMGVSILHGTFTMKGGTITGCSVGVQAGENTEIHLSGSPKIIGNKRYNSESPNNVMIVSGARVTIGGPLDDGAQIGVRSHPKLTDGNDVVIATNDGSFDMRDQLKYFTSDDEDEGILVKAAETALVLSTSDEDVHYHDGISYTAWTDALAKAQHDDDDSFKASNCLPTAPGNYYLTEDVSLNETWNASADTVNLCLNGKKIQREGGDDGALSVASGKTLNLYDCGEGGAIASENACGVTVNPGSTFAMNGGEIAGNRTGVLVNPDGTFAMNGGKIAGNRTGVRVVSTGAFAMNGGEIVGNNLSPSSDESGGVIVGSSSTFSISGSPIISGNGGNLRMPSGSTMAVSGELDKSKASIGLTLLDGDKPVKGVFTTGLAEKGLVATEEDARAIFSSDSDDFVVALTADGKEARLLREPVPYRAWDGSAVADVPGGCTDYELLDENTTELKGGTWYVVDKDIDIADGKRIWVVGSEEPAHLGEPAHLILCDGATLTAGGGVDVSGAAALSIYGQSGNTGALVATVPVLGSEDDPSAAGSSAGIGGGMEVPDGGAVAVHGGKVEARGGAGAAGIGGGSGGSGGEVTVYGGEVAATGGAGAAGIGGGSKGSGGTVTINGGTVYARSASPAKHAIGYGDGGAKDGSIILGKGVTLGGSEDGKDWADLTKSTTTRMAIMKSPYISPKTSIAKAKVTLEKTSYTYDGKAKKPAVKSVVLGGATLKEGTDYTVSYKDNVKVGTATVTVTGKGNYKDSASATFTIKAAPASKTSIAKAKVTLSKKSYTYDGKAKKPRVKSVVLNGKKLKVGADYTVAYRNNEKLGTATVIVTGKGAYKDSAKATFKIVLAKAKLKTEGQMSASLFTAYWGKVAGAKGYQLQYRQAGGKWKTLSAKGAPKDVGGLKAGKFYQFRVRAVAGKQKGAWSNVSKRYLRSVKGVKATVGKPGTVTATWQANPKANAGYVVVVRYKKHGKAVAKKKVAAGKTSATVRGLKADKRLLVQVRPLRTSGDLTYAGVLRGTWAKEKSAKARPAQGGALTATKI